MKKIMNKPETLVREMCNGLVLAHPELDFNDKFKVISKKKLNPDKVTLISGGGSGHEPAHAGFVGSGMLDAAVCGRITSYNVCYTKLLRTRRSALLHCWIYRGLLVRFAVNPLLPEAD